MWVWVMEPAEKYPHVFPKGSFWDKYPYFLPCFIMSSVAFARAIACIWIPVFSVWAIGPPRLRGLNFTTDNVGDVFAISGAALIIHQLILFPYMENTCGPITISRISAVLSIPLLQSYPFIAMLSGITLYIVISTHIVFFVMNLVEGLGILMMFKPFLGEKNRTPSDPLQ